MIKSHLLYQLSYAPGTSPESPSGRRRLAKRIRNVQQAPPAIPDGFGDGFGTAQNAKSRRIPAA
jgi:hypothetical protein